MPGKKELNQRELAKIGRKYYFSDRVCFHPNIVKNGVDYKSIILKILIKLLYIKKTRNLNDDRGKSITNLRDDRGTSM